MSNPNVGKKLHEFPHAPKNFDTVDPEYEGAPIEFTNRIRAEKAAYGLEAYWGEQGYEDPQTIAKDFLTDLLHWGDGQGIDIEELLASASRTYSEEQP